MRDKVCFGRLVAHSLFENKNYHWSCSRESIRENRSKRVETVRPESGNETPVVFVLENKWKSSYHFGSRHTTRSEGMALAAMAVAPK